VLYRETDVLGDLCCTVGGTDVLGDDLCCTVGLVCCRQNQDGYVQPRNFTSPGCPPLAGPDGQDIPDPGEPKLIC